MVDGTVQTGTATVLLFRAVSHAESADVTNNGILRAGPKRLSMGKFFAGSGGDAYSGVSRWRDPETSGF
jgi:hypothetical protein